MGGFGGKRKRETPEEQDLRQIWKDVIQLGEQLMVHDPPLLMATSQII